MKYFIWSREKNPMVIMGRHSWYYTFECDSFREVQKIIERSPDLEFRVVKGKELDWETETEEVTRTETVVKSKKLVYE